MKLSEALVQIATKEIGVTEVNGTNCGPRVDEYKAATWLNPKVGWPWCFRGDVDILTSKGWLPLSRVTEEDMVAQVSETGGVSFTPTLSLIKKKYVGEGWHVKTRTLDFVCDKQHQFWGYWGNRSIRNGNRSIGNEFRSLEGLTKNGLSIPRVETLSIGVPLADREIQLLAAFLADGFYHKGRIEIQVSKEKKLVALRCLSPDSEIPAKKAYGASTAPLTAFTFKKPRDWDALFVGYKELVPGFAEQLSAEQAALFVETYAFYDGSVRKQKEARTITTTNKSIREALITTGTLAGFILSVNLRAPSGLGSKEVHIISYSPAKRTRTLRQPHVSRIALDEILYCVEVPEGRILVRDKNGNPFVSGNCAAFVCWCFREALILSGVKETKTFKRPRTAGAWDFENWSLAQDSTTNTRKPHKNDILAGDIVIFKFSHIGIAISAPDKNGNVVCIEGNTDGAGSREGGAVLRKTRHVSKIRSRIRLNA